jgi:hypothetical protein
MKKLLAVSVVIATLSIVWGGQAWAQDQKELTFSGTDYFSGTAKVFRLDADHVITQIETMGVKVNDSGDGPFHKAATHIVGLSYTGKGQESKGILFLTWVDKDGDKVVWELSGDWSSGKGKLIGGTGKYADWEQGTMDYALQHPKGFPEGTFRGIARDENIRVTTK